MRLLLGLGDRRRSVLKTTHDHGEPNTTRSNRKRNHQDT